MNVKTKFIIVVRSLLLFCLLNEFHRMFYKTPNGIAYLKRGLGQKQSKYELYAATNSKQITKFINSSMRRLHMYWAASKVNKNNTQWIKKREMQRISLCEHINGNDINIVLFRLCVSKSKRSYKFPKFFFLRWFKSLVFKCTSNACGISIMFPCLNRSFFTFRKTFYLYKFLSANHQKAFLARLSQLCPFGFGFATKVNGSDYKNNTHSYP